MLIYLESDIQKKIVALFHHSLNSGGILFLGTSETIGDFGTIFATVDSKWKIFRKKAGSHSGFQTIDFPMPTAEYPAVKHHQQRVEPDFIRLAEETLLDYHTPPAVVMDRKGDVRYIHGRISRYFEIPQGPVRNYNAMEMARGGLKVYLVSMMRSLTGDSEPLVRRVYIEAEEGIDVKVTIRPLAGLETGGLFIVLFEEQMQDEQSGEREPARQSAGKGDSERVRELEDELSAARERLRTMLEELESSNEELRSANEEYQSTNEELQSANEELNSSKEELQSLNEELETVNSELQAKVQQVERAYDEMTSMLNSLEAPLIFLDQHRRIKRFSTSAGEIVELLDSDVGRPLGQLAHKVKNINLDEEAEKVLKSGKTVEKPVATRDGHSYFMRILEYQADEKSGRGAVIFFSTPRN